MSSVAEEEYEHWPSDDKLWSEKAAPALGYDSNNGLQRYAYLPAKSPSPDAPETATTPAPAPVPVAYSTSPQPFYFAHGFPAQYHTYPPPGQAVHIPSNQGYYVYSGNARASAPDPAPSPMPQPTAPRANLHVYQPAYSEPKKEPMPQPNAWIGRSKKQIDKDNMKIAKKEGANERRKIAPTGVSEDQLFWVVDVDDSTELRFYRDIKDMNGSWKKDPRFEDTYYFLCEKVEEKK